MIEEYFKNYKCRFNQLKTSNSNSIFSISIFNAIAVSFLISWHCSYYTWVFLGNFELPQMIWEASTYAPVIYLSIICLTVLDKITFVVLHINLFGQKIVFRLIQQFDLWYWKKYHKQGPLSQTLWRFQLLLIKLKPHQKRQIAFGALVAFAVYYCWRLEAL